MKTYRTLQGDTFDIIAFRLWKDEHLCSTLMDANPGYMDALIFPAGIELNIPDFVKEPKRADLPPWYK